MESPSSLASVRGLPLPIILFQIFDEVTEHAGTLQSFTAGVTVNSGATQCQLLNDVELLEILNGLGVSKADPSPVAVAAEITVATKLAEAHVRGGLDKTEVAVCKTKCSPAIGHVAYRGYKAERRDIQFEGNRKAG